MEAVTKMIFFPAIDLKDGQCVRLYQGDMDKATVFSDDPAAQAKAFQDAGCEWVHLVDLNGAFEGKPVNGAAVNGILDALDIPVQLGGGFRSRERVEKWIDKGAGRIVVGTMAAHDPDLLNELAKFHPDQIVMAVDVYQGSVMTEGWQSQSAFDPAGFIGAYDASPLAGIIVTDIDADIADRDASLGVITRLAAETRHPVIARGTVRSTDDVARLKYVHNIAGALIGRALLSRDVDLAEALDVARPVPEPTAEFQ